jgi:diguanylate cyclase (GGDEF)-like protein
LGGDEFAVLLEHTDELNAWLLALRIVETVDEHAFHIGGVRVPLSVAVGVSLIHRQDTPATVIERADKELYRIKGIQPER